MRFNREASQLQMKRLSVIVALFLWIPAFSAPKPSAQSNNLKQTAIEPLLIPMKMSVQPGDQLAIKGFKGHVQYLVDESSQNVSVEVSESAVSAQIKYREEWQVSFKRDESQIHIFVDGPIAKQVWNEILVTNALPEFYLKITGPSLPVSINWHEGVVTVINLNSAVKITTQKAKVAVVRGAGNVSLSANEGQITVADRKGEVQIDSYLAHVEVSNIEGKLTLENFTGESVVRNINGDVDLNSYKGVTRLAEVRGRLEFKNGVSPLHIENFEGELRGRSSQGAIFADVRGEADVRVESAEGPVNLRLPASGAWVNLGTAEGSLTVPNFLKLTRLQTQQIRTGRLRGSKGGSVFVRTTSGDIRIR